MPKDYYEDYTDVTRSTHSYMTIISNAFSTLFIVIKVESLMKEFDRMYSSYVDFLLYFRPFLVFGYVQSQIGYKDLIPSLVPY